MLKNILFVTAFLMLCVSISTAQTGKKNARPVEENAGKDKTEIATLTSDRKPAVYEYEFSQPNFLVSHVSIKHDQNGKGQIKIGKKDFDGEEYTDPIQLSEATMQKLDNIWKTLNFLDSSEIYQSTQRDYGHLGNMTFHLAQDGRERTAKFNWSENADAQELAHEYKKITNQYVWMFDINVARENQPLESPRIMNTLDSLIRRDEVSDAQQLIPFLKKLSDDEHVPLITRNHALRLVKEIENKK